MATLCVWKGREIKFVRELPYWVLLCNIIIFTFMTEFLYMELKKESNL